MMRALIVGLLFLLGATSAVGQRLPIFDAHIHYSEGTWERMPPGEAVGLLRKAGVSRALVSSSNDEGTQKLYAAAPDIVLPSLRPYRTRSDIGTWFRDAAIVAYLEERLSKHRYVALGEFHVHGADADAPVVRRVVRLAKQHNLFLHAHSDADAVERLFRQDPDARILWAHSGFAQPQKVRDMLRKYRNLWCELAFRTDHAPGGKLAPDWRVVLLEFPDRFMVGTDTYSAERWPYVVEHANSTRGWLAELPADVAARIAHRNGEALFSGMLAPRKP
jgi:hypothetical protein